MLNLGQIKTRVKRQFGDEAGVQITDDDILRWANDGQRAVVVNNENVLQKIEPVDLIEGQQSYTIPSTMLIVQSITCKSTDSVSYTKLEGRSLQQFDIFVDGWDGNQFGIGFPSIYTIFANEIRLFPIPSFSFSPGLKIYGSRRPVDLTSDDDFIDLPEEYHSAVVDYCLQMAHELDDNWNASSAKAAQVAQNLRLNRNRDDWKSQDFYPFISISSDDYGN